MSKRTCRNQAASKNQREVDSSLTIFRFHVQLSSLWITSNASPHRWRRRHWICRVSPAAEERDDSVNERGQKNERQHDHDEREIHRIAADGCASTAVER